jgi:dipeptidyl aminopeptidase/acylaminoacyl peptidase
VPFYGIYDFVDRDGPRNDVLEDFLAKRVFKSRLDEDRRRWDQASPIRHAGPHAPPFLVLHGTNDSLVPLAQPRAFVTALRSQSARPVVYAEVPGAQHAFEAMLSVRTRATVHAVERFLAVVRSERGRPLEAVTHSMTEPASRHR